MIIRRIAQGINQQNWFTVAVEVMVVVVGIFIGLQVDEWNEERKMRLLEIEYLDRMAAEFDQLIASEEGRLLWNSVRINQAEKLLTALNDKELIDDDASAFPYWIYYLGVINRPRLSWGVVEELRSTGNIQLIQSLDLRQALTDLENEYKWVDQLLEEGNVLVRAYRPEILKLLQVVTPENRDTNTKLVTKHRAEDFWQSPEIINMISQIAAFQVRADYNMRENLKRLSDLSAKIKATKANLMAP